MTEADSTFGGRYRLLERIGAGGMGVVYRGEQLALGRIVAIKMLRPDLAAIPEVIRRFHVEARAASRLFHPGSVAIYDYGVTPTGTPFLVMEHITGEPLWDYIRTHWPVPLPTVIDLGLQILAAVGDAHACGVIHADIKSDNVLIETGRDGTPRAKIVDYGLARLIDEDHDASCGTPEYMAPEVACGKPVTVLADLYSVGATLYEMLTGEPPFTGDTPDEVLDRQVADEVLPPSTRQPSRDIPAALEAVVLKALAKTAEARYPSAAEFAIALEQARPRKYGVKLCVCGARLPAAAQACLGCGAGQPGATRVRFVDASTASWDPRELSTSFARGTDATVASPEDQIAELRTRIGTAITHGALDAIAEGYLELSGLIHRQLGAVAAAAELEEGVDVLTGGEGPRALRAPPRVWELLVELAQLHAAAGDRTRARAAAADAQFQAIASRSAFGEGQSEAVLDRLRGRPTWRRRAATAR